MQANLEPLDNPFLRGTPMFRCFVPGIAAPKGSKKVFNGRPVEASPWLKAWDAALDEHLLTEMTAVGPVRVELVFYMRKPASAKRIWPTVTPDLDKLVRAVFDGMTRNGLIIDDAQIVQLTAQKQYALDGMEPGCLVEGWTA